MGENENQIRIEPTTNQRSLPFLYHFTFIVESLVLVSVFVYLIMSSFNNKTLKQTFKNGDKILIYGLLCIIGTLCFYALIRLIDSSFNKNIKFGEEEVEKEEIVTINESGVYTLSGNFNYSVIVEVKDSDDVTLILDNVNIHSKDTAAIIGLKGKSLTIKTTDTKNILMDGGNSQYVACVYSEIPLIFDGEGTLTITSKQSEGEGIATDEANLTINDGTIVISSNDDELNAGGDNGGMITINNGEVYIDASGDGIDSNGGAEINGGKLFVVGSDVGGDAGIDTDSGFEINGGVVVALGSDMIERPKDTSKQNVIAFQLDDKIQSNTVVSLINDSQDEIISFKATKSFKTIIISSPKLENTTYYLYKDGKHSGELINGIYTDGTYTGGSKISVNNMEELSLTSSVTLFGKK